MFNGKKLAYQRKQAGFSQEQLAKKLNVSLSSIAMYETNKRQPDNATILNMSKLFNVSTDYLLDNDLKDINVSEDNKKLVQSLADGLTNPLNKALYSKASELKNDRDKEAVLKVIEAFINDVDSRDN